MTREPPQYVATRVRERLAGDARTAELGIGVDVRGDVIYLRGEVATAGRCERATAVAREAAPDHEIRNELVVTEAGEPKIEELP